MVNRPNFADHPSPSVNRGEMPPASSPSPAAGSPYQPSHNGYGNYNSQPPNRYQPATPTPAPGQRQIQPLATFGSPANNEIELSPSTGNRYAPVTPVQPSTPNYNSSDDRRYPSPKVQQTEQPGLRVSPGYSGGRVVAPVTAPATPVRQPEANQFTPPVAQPMPAQPLPVESRASYSQPQPAGSQSHSAPPAQPQRSGGNRNQNGQQ
jgi:hypothetical protein